jgi:DNA-binding MarR family transcriptional regulator
MEAPVEAIEAAMVRIRRRQTRGALARSSGSTVPDSLIRTLDAIGSEPQSTVGSLTKALAVDQPRASRLVAQAISAGLAQRLADQADGRRAILELTDDGKDLLDGVRTHRLGAMDEAMRGWSARDRKEFARLLTKFVDALDRS